MGWSVLPSFLFRMLCDEDRAGAILGGMLTQEQFFKFTVLSAPADANWV